MTLRSPSSILLALSLLIAAAHAQTDLAHQIATTPAIDNHAHPTLPDPVDRDFDALPVDNMEPETDTVAWRPDNPQLPQAWKALWNIDATAPAAPDTLKRIEAARIAIKTREGAHYPAWVLDQSHIETMLANRVTMGNGAALSIYLAEPRFRWVPYADALLFPCDTTALAQATPDRKLFLPMEDHLRTRYLQQAGFTTLPATLGDYLAKVVTPTLERQHAAGAIAEKFELAYLRDFNITDPTRAEAARIYNQSRPGPADYKRLQDFLFRYIAAECGRLHMAVHLHAMAGGGSYFSIAGANPLLLEPLFNDPRLRHTSFVLLHGGWPFVREAGALLQKPNVYLDLSQETLTFSPHTLAGWLREWLETYPDKVLFGTDGYPYSASMGWEESTWLANRNGRAALTLALTGMLDDHEITPTRASAIASAVLRNNAATLYAPR